VIEAAEEPDEDEVGEPEEPVHEQEIVPASEAEVPPLPLSVSESGE
jgi:hypothetical protein